MRGISMPRVRRNDGLYFPSKFFLFDLSEQCIPSVLLYFTPVGVPESKPFVREKERGC